MLATWVFESLLQRPIECGCFLAYCLTEPATRGPSNTNYGGGIARGDWFAVGGGESGFATPDP